MKKTILLIVLMTITSALYGQKIKKEFPKVHPDGRVEFRIMAPDANSIQIELEGRYDMTRNEMGEWTCVTEPKMPGFHYYFVFVDGARLADPDSESYYGFGASASGIEVPYPAEKNHFNLNDVPHGLVHQIRYHSDIDDTDRRMFVYTPPGYDACADKEYPVLYLIHGGGEDERGWFKQGRADILMDNLLADKAAEDMLIVSLDGNAASFQQELMKYSIPLVEKHFKARKGGQNRALAGLSRGGLHTLETAFAYPDLFSYIGVFSSGFITRKDTHKIVRTSPDELYAKMEKDLPHYKECLKLIYLTQGGPQDISYDDGVEMKARLDKIGMDYEYFETPGGHSWIVWRESLNNFARLVFK